MRGGAAPPGPGYNEAIPEWEQGLRFQNVGGGGLGGQGGGAGMAVHTSGPGDVQYASVVADGEFWPSAYKIVSAE